MIQLYRPGASVLHRLPAGVKLAALAVIAIVLSTFAHDAVSIAGALCGVGLLFLVAGLPLRVLGTEVWRLRWLVLVLGLALWIFVSPQIAWINTGRVVALILLASLLTITTRMSELLAVLRTMLQPLRRWNDTEAAAMTVSLAIAMIPVVSGFAGDIADAQRARGTRLGVRAVVPLMVRTLRHADDVGDALAARGLV
ncbi:MULTISPECIES: energy-coupling factor transporter transmembrane component T family protein [unclassified Microbacterium]|uniref:energy-coupling factor transporter transmembrane component T family protein n=1 Tax=unclassified Microbacterium TaxID=2609290 RepID=UPI0034393B52